MAATAAITILAAACFLISTRQISVVQASSHKDREAGEILFRERGCQHCHGVEGIGTELGPDLSTVGKRLKKHAIEQQILKGGEGMPAFGNVLAPDEVASLVAYLNGKRKPTTRPSASQPAPAPKPVQPAGTDPGI